METEAPGRLGDETPFSSRIPDSPRNIQAEVWRVAWPSVLTFALMTTNTILDRAFVGQLGRDALAGVGVGGQVLFMLVSLSMAITTGTTALVARFTGARTPEEVNHAAGQSLSLSLCIGVVCTLALFFALEPLLHLLGLEAAARAQVRAFLYYALLGMVPMFLANVLGSVYRGMGDTRTPLKVMLFANIVHILGDWTLMLGHWGFPRLGLAGGGIAVTASNVVALLVYLRMVRRSGFRDSVRFAHLRLTLEWIWRILRIGIPAAITALLRVTSMMGFTGLLARTAEGTSAVAALPIGMTAESIAFMPGLGFSIAASALVGQALGARDPSRAERYGWAAAWQAVAIMSFMGLVFFLGAEPFARVFTRDPVVLRLAVSYLQIMAISEPMLAFGMVFTGALQGAGDTMRPTVLTAITFWGVRIPAAWLLALQLGLQAKGAWIAMSFTTIVGGFFTVLLFRDGKWKRVRV